jgi:MOSC domain-containing protein YiiM
MGCYPESRANGITNSGPRRTGSGASTFGTPRSRLRSLNVGLPKPLAHGKGFVQSGFVKAPAAGPLWLNKTGLEGDGQADLKVHGGPEKAACLYPLEHYPYWEDRLGRRLPEAAFGENFSTEGFVESEVCIGDVFRVAGPVGSHGAVVQVSQPRQPCYKLAARHGVKKLALWVQESGLTGFYFRVLEEGEVEAGVELVLAERSAPSATVAEANRVMHRDKEAFDAIERLLALPELSASWRRTFEKRLAAGRPEDVAERLEGPSRRRAE